LSRGQLAWAVASLEPALFANYRALAASPVPVAHEDFSWWKVAVFRDDLLAVWAGLGGRGRSMAGGSADGTPEADDR
jgi:hypothetical protein